MNGGSIDWKNGTLTNTAGVTFYVTGGFSSIRRSAGSETFNGGSGTASECATWGSSSEPYAHRGQTAANGTAASGTGLAEPAALPC